MTTIASSVKTYGNFIDGKWVPASSGNTSENRNPADNRELLGVFQRSAEPEVNLGVEAADAAFHKWSRVPAPRRAEIIIRTAAILEERKEEYARDMTREMGKVLKETRGDVQEAIDTAYYFAGEGRRMFGLTTPSELPNKFAMCSREPVGVCGMICPWNFPMAIPSWKLFPALVAGNTCVIKPAEITPLSLMNLMGALTEAGLPPGVVNVVTGHAHEVGAVLTQHPLVRAVSFTGSTEVGRIIGESCSRTFKRCALEMGGKNPMIVLDDANLELALEGALWGPSAPPGSAAPLPAASSSRRAFTTALPKSWLAARRSCASATASMRGWMLGRSSAKRRWRPCCTTSKSAGVRERGWSAAEIASTPPSAGTATSSSPRSSPTSTPRCASRRRRSSAPSSP